MKEQLPISEKYLLTVEEASRYSNIGINRMREIAKQAGCPFTIYSGRNILIKRKEFEKYLDCNEAI